MRSLRNESERLDRRIHLLRPASEQEFIGSLYWLSQRGVDSDLDLIFKIKGRAPFSRDALLSLETAEQEIIKREHHELYRFFGLSPSQFARVIKATIEQGQRAASADSARGDDAERPTEVIGWLREIRSALERLFGSGSVAQWLEVPLEDLGGQTPLEGLLEGKTWPLLQHLKSSQ